MLQNTVHGNGKRDKFLKVKIHILVLRIV